MAKKAKSRKRTVKSAKSRKTARKPAKRATKTKSATTAKRKTAKRKPTKAAKTRNAARAAASRKRKTPAPPPSTLTTVATAARGMAATAVAAVAKLLPWSKDENDPIVLLETDHRRFESLLDQGESTTDRGVKTRTDVLEALAAGLTVHEAIEERILYPALKPHAAAHDIVLEGFQEHHVADVLIKELKGLAKDDEKWGAKFKVLKESVTHHIQEEESKMFRIARGALAREELLALGARMRALKTELER